jgi:type IV pilus assembly protein PilY1
MLEANDAGDKSVQSFYAVSDQAGGPLPAGRAMLARRQMSADGAGGYRLEGSALSASGWLLDFAFPGERMIASPVVVDGSLYFETMRPGAAPCAPAGGLYQLEALTGQPPAAALAPWLGMAVLPGRTLAVAPDRRPGPPGGGTIPGAPASDSVLGAGAGQPVPSIVKKSRAGRLGWREVIDWEANRNAMPQK